MSKKTSGKAPRFNDVEFIQCELSDEQKKDLKSRKKEGFDAWQLLDGLCEQGYRVTVKYDNWSSSMACFIQPIDEEHENANRILSGRGRTAEGAVLELLYKHFFIFDGVWPIASFKGKPVMWDD